jgi:N-ethylmaleimide reductase
VVQAAIDVFGSDRVGIRFSPFRTFGNMQDENPLTLYTKAIQVVTGLDVVYVYLIEPRAFAEVKRLTPSYKNTEASVEKFINEIRKGESSVIRPGGYLSESADEVVKADRADLIAFERRFISNPDLPVRIRNNWPLDPYARKTFYTPGPEGYVNYPVYSERVQ